MTVKFHFCKGNFKSHWLYNGSFDRIAKHLLNITKFGGFFLEFGDERAGSFEPLKHLKDQRLVLGLITTKRPELEDPIVLKDKILAASEFVPLELLVISPQCGFSSTHEGNALTIDAQWEKLKHVIQTAKDICLDA